MNDAKTRSLTVVAATVKSNTWVSGHDPKIWELAIIHLRASGPCSFGGLRHWLLRQSVDVNEDNVDRVTHEFIDGAKERRVISVDPVYGDIEYIYPTKH